MQEIDEEILEAIWTAEEAGEPSARGVRERCPVDVEEWALMRLADKGLVTRDGDTLALTDVGREHARSVVRRHRLAVSLFATVLSIDAKKREAIACEVEHTLLPEVEQAICTLLGHPTECPDGQPIPPGHCCAARRTSAATVIVNLTHLGPGERGRISYIKPKSHQRLHRLTSFGLTPGTVVELHQRFPAYCIRFEGTELAIDSDVAEDIFVARV